MEKNSILYLTFLLNVGYCVSEIHIPKLPPYLKICQRSDPNWNRCMKNNVEQLKPYLKEGISDLHIPPCEPLHIDRLDLNQTTASSSITSTFTDIKIYNGINFILKYFKLDANKDELKLKIYNPRLDVISKYSLNGDIMKLPLKGNGLSSANLTDVDLILKVRLERYNDSETKEEHYRVNDINVDCNVHNVKLHLDNLFDGDKTLTDVINLFLNDNWKLIAAKFKPALEENVAGIFKTIMNNIFSKYPIDVFLPL